MKRPRKQDTRNPDKGKRKGNARSHHTPNFMDDVSQSSMTEHNDTNSDELQHSIDAKLDRPVELSAEVAELIASLERERDEAVDARRRALADYVNFQKRSLENESRARRSGLSSVLHSLLPVLDHFDMALNQDMSKVTVEQLAGGVRIVRDELVKALEQHGVTRIMPARGDAFDPHFHEAMLKTEAEGIEPGHVVAMLQPGFALGDLILRAAKVSIAPEED